MIENRVSNTINRRSKPYQEISATPNPKYNQNIINKNNYSNNNSMNKQNVRINNLNINKNNIINNQNNRIMNNNINRNVNNPNPGPNGNINKALMVIRNEFRKKNEKIKALELKVAELENKINMIKLNKNSGVINLTNPKIGSTFTFAEKYSGEIDSNYSKRDLNKNKTPEINYNRGNNPFRNKEGNQNMNNNFYAQTKSANQYKIKNNNDNEFSTANKNNNVNDAVTDGSVFTGNSSNYQKHSKNEVKLYLKEVKAKVDPIIFKEFIQNIKLLTNSKESNGVNKSDVIEKVRILFGEEFKDLFIKFESIIGF